MHPVSTAQLLAPFDQIYELPAEPYAAWILAGEKIPAEAQLDVARRLIDSGCRYAVCSGVDSSSWHDAVDIAYVSQIPEPPNDDANFVMTSWHHEETPEEVARFFVLNTAFDYFVPGHFLILGIGRGAPIEDAMRLVRSELDDCAT
jgi:hypothetical protein